MEQLKGVTIVKLPSHYFSQVVRFKLLLSDISLRTFFTNDDIVKYVIGALQWKFPRTPYPLIRIWLEPYYLTEVLQWEIYNSYNY